MFYQWGRKDPFTFATNSEKGGVGANDYGKSPVKIHTIDGVLIYQESNGSSNTNKQPAGGLLLSSTDATSMMETIKNPITFYGFESSVITQVGYSKSLWDYYWASYSRGTDGHPWVDKPFLHNNYLDGYTSQRVKSIYDPCPYGFRTPSNGSGNSFSTSCLAWILYSYVGGVDMSVDSFHSWNGASGRRIDRGGTLESTARVIVSWFSTSSSNTNGYGILSVSTTTYLNYIWSKVSAHSVRCIVLLS